MVDKKRLIKDTWMLKFVTLMLPHPNQVINDIVSFIDLFLPEVRILAPAYSV